MSSARAVLASLSLLLTWSCYFQIATGTQFYAPTCDAHFIIANDTGYNGYDLITSHNVDATLQYSSTQDPATCCSYCFNLSSCTAWSAVDAPGYGCYLKNASYFQMAATATVGGDANTTVSGYRISALPALQVPPSAAPAEELQDSPAAEAAAATAQSELPPSPAPTPANKSAGCCSTQPTSDGVL